MHGSDVSQQSGSELFGMNMLLEDGKDLVEQLLLMQVVKLEGCVHLENHGVLVSKPWQLVHDSGD